MARRKPVEPAARRSTDARDAPPPLELLRCPWTRWDSADRSSAPFEAWLRDRQAWREDHDAPLPPLFSRDRMALHHLAEQLDPAVTHAEEIAPKAEPEWITRAKAAGNYPGFPTTKENVS